MKVLALYLPQYHEIKENNEWWGEGYTEWKAVKNAIPYFVGHIQPRVPIDEDYYDLSDESAGTLKKQASLAREYNVYGFVFYHYWFKSGKQLLEKPLEILLNHPEIDIHYSICWANESWTRAWYGVEEEVLVSQEYGDKKEWENHFDYLLRFFKDKRYIKIDNKPMVHIYHSFEINDLDQMLECWNDLAQKSGFSGLYIVSGNTGKGIEKRRELVDAYYNFEPSYSLIFKTSRLERTKYGIAVKVRELWNRMFEKKKIERVIDGKKFVNRMIRGDQITNCTIYPGVFPQWDNTPRRKYKGTYFLNMNPQTFEHQINTILKKYGEVEYLYVNAWNEWGEGAYLEPDNVNGYEFLQVIKNAFK